jgi:hypothetical protein
MSSDTVARYVLKPAAMAATAAALSAVWRPGTQALVSGKAVALPLVVAGATFAGAELAALTNAYLFEHLPLIPKALQYPAHTALNVGVVTGGIVGIENFFSPGLVGDQGLAEVAAIAALSELVSSYVTTEWLQRWYEDLMA